MHIKNKTGIKALDVVARDPRVVVVRREGNDGYWADLAEGYAFEGETSSVRADTALSLIEDMARVEEVAP